MFRTKRKVKRPPKTGLLKRSLIRAAVRLVKRNRDKNKKPINWSTFFMKRKIRKR